MLINKSGAEFLYNGITYRVGDVIIGSDQSEYAGLIGSILEIRDGNDKETENDTPDIYCSFDPRHYRRTLRKWKLCSRTCMTRKRHWMTSVSIWSLWLRK